MSGRQDGLPGDGHDTASCEEAQSSTAWFCNWIATGKLNEEKIPSRCGTEAVTFELRPAAAI
jgi:hypothetical protein